MSQLTNFEFCSRWIQPDFYVKKKKGFRSKGERNIWIFHQWISFYDAGYGLVMKTRKKIGYPNKTAAETALWRHCPRTGLDFFRLFLLQSALMGFGVHMDLEWPVNTVQIIFESVALIWILKAGALKIWVCTRNFYSSRTSGIDACLNRKRVVKSQTLSEEVQSLSEPVVN